MLLTLDILHFGRALLTGCGWDRETPAPKASWALLVEDIAADGSRTERMRASGAIATIATHAGNAACIAARQTRQVAHQAAAGKGLPPSS